MPQTAEEVALDTHFTPAIPAESTWLEVCSESGIVRFDLLEGRGGEPKA
jgi:hypothetical protein